MCGVGFMGQGKWKSKINGKATKEYSTWLHMMTRCYSERSHKENPTYSDVIVSERWHCFQNFCNDISKLKGYNDWKNNDGYELDKDIICELNNIIPKIYSLETCMFIKKSENLSESTSRNNKLKAKKKGEKLL